MIDAGEKLAELLKPIELTRDQADIISEGINQLGNELEPQEKDNNNERNTRRND